MRTYVSGPWQSIEDEKAKAFAAKVDYFLKDLGPAMQRITVGQVPDGSGDPIGGGGTLTDYWYLPGRSGGQLGYGGSGPGESATISSTKDPSKGYIYFGDGLASMYDEGNAFLGINITPDASLDVKGTAISGTQTLLPSTNINAGDTIAGDGGVLGITTVGSVRGLNTYTGAPSAATQSTPSADATALNSVTPSDNTLWVASRDTVGGANPQACGLNAEAPAGVVYTIEYRCCWLSAPPGGAKNIQFRLIASDGNWYGTGNIDVSAVPVGDGNWTTYTTTIDTTTGGTAAPVGHTINSIEMFHPNATAYFCVTYLELSYDAGGDIVHVADSGGTVGVRVDNMLRVGIGTALADLTSLVTIQSGAGNFDEPLLTLFPDASQNDNVFESWNYSGIYRDFTIGPGGLVTVASTDATDDDVRFQVRAPSSQTTANNIAQFIRSYNVGGTNLYSALTVGGDGAVVIGDTLGHGAGVIRLRINQGSSQSVDMFQVRNTAGTSSLVKIDSVGAFTVGLLASGVPITAIYDATSGSIVRIIDSGANVRLAFRASSNGTVEQDFYRAGSLTSTIRSDSSSVFSVLGSSALNMIELTQSAGTGIWADSSNTATLHLFDSTPNSSRVIIENEGGLFSRLGILSTGTIFWNTTTNVPTPTAVLDVRSGTGTGTIVLHARPNQGQTVATIDTTVTDNSAAAAGLDGLWRLIPTLNCATEFGAGVEINAQVVDLTATQIGGSTVQGIDVTISGTGTTDDFGSGGHVLKGLNFLVRSTDGGSESQSWSTVQGVGGQALHRDSVALSSLTGMLSQIGTSSGAGTTTDGRCFYANPQTITGTVTTLALFAGSNPLGAGGITTLVGLDLPNLTRGSTNRAIRSLGGSSVHVGNFFFGANTAPTAKVHLGAGTTSASTAPTKHTSGSLMTVAEAGAGEYDGSYFYLTNATTRGQICTTANVVVDGDGNVVTADGEILLAA